MKNQIRYYFILFLILGLWLSPLASAFELPAQPSGYIIDLDQDKAIYEFTVDELNQDLKKFEATHGMSIYVLFVKTLGEESPEAVSAQAFQRWKLGGPEENALLLLLSREDQKISIQIGEGLSKKLTQPEADHIIETYIQAKFQELNYNDAVFVGVLQLKKALSSKLPTTTHLLDEFGIKLLIFLGLALLLLIGIGLYGERWLLLLSLGSLSLGGIFAYFSGLWDLSLNILFGWLLASLGILIWFNLPQQKKKKKALSPTSHQSIEKFKFVEGDGQNYDYQDYNDIHGDSSKKYSADAYKAARRKAEDEEPPKPKRK